MPVFTPTILAGPPDVQASMAGGITYEEFATMLGTLNLFVAAFFVEAPTGSQVDTNLGFSIFDASGTATSDVIKPRKDPYQFQNSLQFTGASQPVVLNGNSSLQFNLQPGQLVTMTLLTDEVDPRSLDPGRLVDNFAHAPDMLGNFARFKRQLK